MPIRILTSPLQRKAALRVAMALGGACVALPAAQADDPAAASPSAHQEHSEARLALRELDRFLDHHPLIEADLRLNPALVGDANYLRSNPDLRDFLRGNSGVQSGLQIYPRYFLFRALLRQASAPLRFADIAPLKELLDRQPEIEARLVANPGLIRDAAFLAAHSALQEFLRRNPALERVFLPHEPNPTQSS